MDLTPHVQELRRQLDVAAEAGGEEARVIAGRLGAAIEAAARLVLLDAIAGAAAEITLDLAPGSVDVRLRGRDPEFVVTPPPADAGSEGQAVAASPVATTATTATASATAAAEADDSGPSRITLRLPEQLKGRIEEAAGSEGLSVNSWLVRTVSAAVGLTDTPNTVRSTLVGGQSFTGWAR